MLPGKFGGNGRCQFGVIRIGLFDDRKDGRRLTSALNVRDRLYPSGTPRTGPASHNDRWESAMADQNLEFARIQGRPRLICYPPEHGAIRAARKLVDFR
jgi:hypothetical protein